MRSFSGEGLLIFRKRRALVAPKALRWWIWIVIAAALVTWAITAFERAIVPTLIAVSETQVVRVANEAMIEAVNQHLASFMNGKEFLRFETGPTGELLYVQVNSSDLNRIQAEALSVLQESLQELEGFQVTVPLGQALGSRIFAQSGPRIPVTLYPYGTVKVQVNNSYDVTGINQTKFEVWLTVTCTVRVVIPLIQSRAEVSTDIPLTTVLIPGKVPPTYLSIPSPN